MSLLAHELRLKGVRMSDVPTPGGKAFNKADACDYLGKISTATLMRRVASGEIRATPSGGRTVFLQADLDAYLADCRERGSRPSEPKPVAPARRRTAARRASAAGVAS